MKVGDLIADKEYTDEPGIILEKRDSEGGGKTYRVLKKSGSVMWFGKRYIENDCEVISESR